MSWRHDSSPRSQTRWTTAPARCRTAGVIKVATGAGDPTPLQREAIIAAAHAQRVTGCPIITHTEAGDDATHQVELFAEHGADLSRVVLSHCDRNADPAYHRTLLQSGVCLEYDQHFRQLCRGDPRSSGRCWTCWHRS